jgi:LacI family transcriptional regulator
MLIDDERATVRAHPGGHRVTLSEVAAASRVSIATASKVVNGRSGVGLETRTRVEAAIESLGYVSPAERLGGAFAMRESLIELLVDPHDISNPYVSLLLSGAMEVAELLHAGLILRSTDVAITADPIGWARSLARSGRAGVIEVTTTFSAARERALRSVGLPLVLVDPIEATASRAPTIGSTNWQGAYAATRHLLALGHTRIAYLGGPPGAGCDILRARGWADAMAEAGLAANRTAVPREGYTFEHGLASGTRMLSQHRPPTAIFAGSDVSATGVLEAARRRGVRVPQELSVVGFDDTVLAANASPPLTTVHQPIADIGRMAVATLMKLARGDTVPVKKVELGISLVVRESTAPPGSSASRSRAATT